MSTRQTMGLTDAAMRLRLTYQAAHRMLLIGQLEGRRDGRNWLVYVDSVETAEKARGRQEGPAPLAA